MKIWEGNNKSIKLSKEKSNKDDGYIDFPRSLLFSYIKFDVVRNHDQYLTLPLKSEVVLLLLYIHIYIRKLRIAVGNALTFYFESRISIRPNFYTSPLFLNYLNELSIVFMSGFMTGLCLSFYHLIYT